MLVIGVWQTYRISYIEVLHYTQLFITATCIFTLKKEKFKYIVRIGTWEKVEVYECINIICVWERTTKLQLNIGSH